MTVVSDEFLARWRQETLTGSGGHVYHRRHVPITQAFIRRGRLRRAHKAWTGPDINGFVVNGDNDTPWQATYKDYSEWIALPNVLSCDLSGSLKDRGQNLVLVVENNYVEPLTGMSGLYHAIRRGYLAPWRGKDTDYTPPAVEDQNDWYQLLDQKLQIKVWQGWGDDELVPTFVGFIDDLDMTSVPDQITITARDTGQIITDQRFYGWAKLQDFPDPLTFADRYATLAAKVGSNADASSSQTGYEASKALDTDADTHWRSDDHTAANVTEWIEIEIPAGEYEMFRINTANYKDMTGYISINSVDGEIDGTPISDGWYDPDTTNVPGTHGGYPYFKNFTSIDGAKNVRFGFTFTTTSDTSRIRIAFRDLKKKASDPDAYRAGVASLYGVQIDTTPPETVYEHILVDDVADVVRYILRWCGFKEWYVEDAGQRLKGTDTCNRGDMLIDLVNRICEQTGFEFFIGDPDTSDDSLGVPAFRMRRALYAEPADDVLTIQETDLLEEAQVAFNTEPLHYNIRVRGRYATKDEGGMVVSRDSRRLLAVYYPPWTEDGVTPRGIRMAGIIKHAIIDRSRLNTQNAVEFAARLSALYMCLEAATAQIQIPANPGIELDTQVLLYDTGTGLNTRMWVFQRDSKFTGGDQPEWTMTVGGSLLDTPFMDECRTEYFAYIASVDDD